MTARNALASSKAGWTPVLSATVAVPPIWFYSSGRISDADILFNGAGFEFTTSAEAGSFDVQDVATHELGHLLGLDHSGWAGASMYPYVDQSVILHRSLSLDEVGGLRHAYPSTSFARISGSVVREQGGTPVAGAHVVARSADGRPARSILTDPSGVFTIYGLEGGDYSLYVDPLDQPVSASNIGAGWTIQTDFGSAHAGTVSLNSGELHDLGAPSIPVNFLIPIEGNPVTDDGSLTPERCLRALCLMRLVNPRAEVRVAAGREGHLRGMESLALWPANSLFVEGYLTTRGDDVHDTYRMIREAGFEVEGNALQTGSDQPSHFRLPGDAPLLKPEISSP